MMNPKAIKEMFGASQAPEIRFSLTDIPIKVREMVGKMSISGVQPKATVTFVKSKSELVIAPAGGEFILKPQTQQFPHLPENENCCMDIAETLGIDVPRHCLLPLSDGTLAYVVKRFDRQGGEKIPMENFYQILEKKDKYSGSLEEIGKKLKEISAVPGYDVQLFFDQVALNFLLGNGDAHFKNYSILTDDNKQIRLSPAYDIVSSKLVIPDDTDSALTLAGKKNKLARKDFDIFADSLKIPEKVRYEKFEGKFGMIKELIQKSELPAGYKTKFLEIVRFRYERLKIKE